MNAFTQQETSTKQWAVSMIDNVALDCRIADMRLRSDMQEHKRYYLSHFCAKPSHAAGGLTRSSRCSLCSNCRQTPTHL